MIEDVLRRAEVIPVVGHREYTEYTECSVVFRTQLHLFTLFWSLFYSLCQIASRLTSEVRSLCDFKTFEVLGQGPEHLGFLILLVQKFFLASFQCWRNWVETLGEDRFWQTYCAKTWKNDPQRIQHLIRGASIWEARAWRFGWHTSSMIYMQAVHRSMHTISILSISISLSPWSVIFGHQVIQSSLALLHHQQH